MQFKAVILATLAAVATASPTSPPVGCTPATYACTTSPAGKPGWKVCDTQHVWQFAGECPPKTKCYFNEQNQSPYCI
ncbi:uncharacterized protein DNG_08004 [Cephalotrichum gorgonifer]|uniref:Uncharacterized protein n=1 Tax=Cephalotrichum gorgonifer TaxID=2041049 RepID=A0AAE8N3J0_9PEZI|nr:uncharacterized protein DNG_08004 [Cephalotrichum gorgonifer]